MKNTIAITVASLLVGGIATLPAHAEEAKNDGPTLTERAGQAIDDAGLLAKIKSSMLRSPEVDGLDVNVDVKDGVVTLSGSADSQAERANAEKIASSADGVKRVENRITVKPDAANRQPAVPATPPATPGAPPALPGTPPVVPAPPAN